MLSGEVRFSPMQFDGFEDVDARAPNRSQRVISPVLVALLVLMLWQKRCGDRCPLCPSKADWLP